jgi:hypothetical protein
MSGHDARTIKRARHDWILADKIWPLDYHVANKPLSADQLADALAKHANDGRAANQVAVPAHGKSTMSSHLSSKCGSAIRANIHSIILLCIDVTIAIQVL